MGREEPATAGPGGLFSDGEAAPWSTSANTLTFHAKSPYPNPYCSSYTAKLGADSALIFCIVPHSAAFTYLLALNGWPQLLGCSIEGCQMGDLKIENGSTKHVSLSEEDRELTADELAAVAGGP
ncbi:hypothetical protein [Methylobacterium nodulans]|uniref:hypothetical protein n=1 Tax=Methylobacterium nodulans TaxID=114616 RepID=UPI0012EDAE53|nr:hypothetical protein [Methylobacterium nodulans]